MRSTLGLFSCSSSRPACPVPAPCAALNEEAGKLLLEGFEDFAKKARLMTSIHAARKPSVLTAAGGANAVNADRVRTGLFSGGVAESRARARGLSIDDYFSSNLLGREVLASDVAQAFAYFAEARATTGCVLTVDGGNAAAFPR